MKIAFVLGTRPEILKLYPVIKEAEKRNIPNILIHTNQHYSVSMDSIFFEEMNLKKPDYNLNIGSADHNLQTGRMLIELDRILKEEKPDFMIVQGDTNSTLAGALAASKLGIKVCHIEAGLRSYDRSMPEEINRIITDSISDYLFAVTEVQEAILKNEGIAEGKIFKVGNTIVDTLNTFAASKELKSSILTDLKLDPENFFLLTLHRPSNVDDKDTLERTLSSIYEGISDYAQKVIWPVHPRTRKNIETFKIKIPSNFILLEPLGYFDFLALTLNAAAIFTDSGGIQEEACILKKPCLTLRKNTERPETIEVGANCLVDNSLEKIREAMNYFKTYNKDYVCPFGDGTSSAKILDVITK